MRQSQHPPIDGQSLSQLRLRTSEKWTGFAPDLLPMPVAEMDFEIAKPIRDVLTEMIANSDTGYMGSSPLLANNFAASWSFLWTPLAIGVAILVVAAFAHRQFIKRFPIHVA